MADVLLQTKLYRPTRSLAQRPFLVTRSHLSHKLDAGVSGKLTLVSAPAGFGKTTMVAAWLDELAEAQRRIGWLSLDENDNDQVRFLLYLIAALQTAVPHIDETAVHLLQSPQPPPTENILALLINDIIQNDQPIVLVLDDYHAINTPAIHQALAFLLDHLPPQLHLLLTTRSDPPLPLSRLRAQGQMVEIRTNDLRFTLDEAQLFFNQVMGLALSHEEMAALEQRTEGWIAGLQLAGLSMQGRDDLSSFIAAFTGSNRFILDYLTDEVLERRPQGTKDFLLQTAILDRLCGPLCDAVTGQSDGQMILEQLEQANLFLIPLDEERHWYRYHHLFAEVLRQRLLQEQPDQFGGLHYRASIWHEQNAHFVEAVSHAFLAGDIERAAQLIERFASAWLEAGIISTLRGWLDALPEEIIKARPHLNLTYAYTLAYTGDPVGFKSRLDKIEQMLRESNTLPTVERNDLLGEVAALQARAASDRNEKLDVDELRTILSTISDSNTRVQGILALAVGHVERLAGNLSEAAHFFTQAANLARERGDRLQAVYTLGFLADLQEAQGFLHQSAQTYQQTMQWATSAGGRLLPAAGTACIGLGRLFYEWNDLEKAGRYLQQAIELGEQGGVEAIGFHSAIPLALVLQAQGDIGEADALIQHAAHIVNKWHLPPITRRISAVQAQLWFRRGQWQQASNWAQANSMSINDDLVETSLTEYCTLARLQIVRAKQDEALLLLDRLLVTAQHSGQFRTVIEILGLQALAWRAHDNIAEALASLKRALNLAQPEGFCRVFLDEGRPMAELLQQARQRGLFPNYIDKLLAAFAAAESTPGAADLLPEPLSQRELDVLQLLATGVSNQDIADQLFIALSTAKKHVSNILVKLDTPNRIQAIARARELGLLL